MTHLRRSTRCVEASESLMVWEVGQWRKLTLERWPKWQCVVIMSKQTREKLGRKSSLRSYNPHFRFHKERRGMAPMCPEEPTVFGVIKGAGGEHRSPGIGDERTCHGRCATRSQNFAARSYK